VGRSSWIQVRLFFHQRRRRGQRPASVGGDREGCGDHEIADPPGRQSRRLGIKSSNLSRACKAVLDFRFRARNGFVRQPRIEAIGSYPLAANELQPDFGFVRGPFLRLPDPFRDDLSHPIPRGTSSSLWRFRACLPARSSFVGDAKLASIDIEEIGPIGRYPCLVRKLAVVFAGFARRVLDDRSARLRPAMSMRDESGCAASRQFSANPYE